MSVPVGAPVARLPPVSSAGSGSLPARVTGPGRQNQNHTAPPVVARAPHVSVHGANSRPCRTPAAPGTAVLSATDRVRKSIDRNHDRRSMEQRSHEQVCRVALGKRARGRLCGSTLRTDIQHQDVLRMGFRNICCTVFFVSGISVALSRGLAFALLAELFSTGKCSNACYDCHPIKRQHALMFKSMTC